LRPIDFTAHAEHNSTCCCSLDAALVSSHQIPTRFKLTDKNIGSTMRRMGISGSSALNGEVGEIACNSEHDHSVTTTFLSSAAKLEGKISGNIPSAAAADPANGSSS
jgi:hypothetical protein